MLSPDVAVGGHVGVEVGDVPERLVADGAAVRGGRAVGRFVLLQVGLLAEGLVAHRALERALACKLYKGMQKVRSRVESKFPWMLT